jgi:carbamoyltransferase
MIVAIYANHDANVTVYSGGKYRIYELERLVKERYFTLNTYDHYEYIYDTLSELIISEFGSLVFDLCIIVGVPKAHMDYLNGIWDIKAFKEGGHHLDHAVGGFALSGFREALVISYDDGGWDYGKLSYFNIYHINEVITELKSIRKPRPGSGYNLLAMPLKEVSKKNATNWGSYLLSFAGKKMGLGAYGKVRKEWIDPVKEFYKHCQGHNPNTLNSLHLGVPLGVNALSGQDSYDLAATSQLAFEEVVFEQLSPVLDEYDLPIILTGGCALNVLFNEKLRVLAGRPVFVQPNPNDCGLSFGMIAREIMSSSVTPITYRGFPILDKDKLGGYIKTHKGKICTVKEIAALLNEGKIIGIMMGDSEVGPRALGNRSILCDPTYPGMKDTLNKKVKYREWYRPYASVVKHELREKYFEFSGDSPFMSFCAKVKPGVNIPAVTHEDGTSRIQTVKEHEHPFLYKLLGCMNQFHGKDVLLNTSFNIKGKPILTTIEDAFHVLDSTEMDYLVVENYIFKHEGDIL